MNQQNRLRRAVLRFPQAAMAIYAVLVFSFIAGTWNAIADIMHRRADVAAADDILARLEGRRPMSPRGTAGADVVPSGSPTLEGSTVTVAGASLLQRVAGAVAKVGGSVLSSQVELQGAQAKAGFIGVIASCELDQTALQKLLYDLEAGMPFLFVDQLVVQSSNASSSDQDVRMRILLTVSGQWQGEQ
jgi:general secretion pathway protein M